MSIDVVVTGYAPIALDVTVPQGADGITFIPDKPTLAIASLSDGSSPVLTDAIINISVMRGINNDTASWVITATPTGCTGTLVNHTTYSTFTVTGMTSDTATVAFSAVRSGFATLSSVSTLTKIKQPDIATVIHAASAATLDDTDEVGFWDSVANALRKITVANIWAWVIGKIEGSTATTTPNDTDVLPGIKADHTSLKYTWTNLKAAILTAIGKTNLATGFTLAGGTTSKTLTVSADADTANVPTANEKTRLSDIQAATGATTALKLANLTSPATTIQQGVVLLAPDGGTTPATAVQANDSRLISAKTAFTPVPKFGGVAEDTGKYVVDLANYVRIRDKISGDIVLRWTSLTALTGDFTFDGFPFAPQNGSAIPQGTVVADVVSGLTAGTSLMLRLAGVNGNYIMKQRTGDYANALTAANFLATTKIYMHFEYIKA